jgi:hypothetical protein
MFHHRILLVHHHDDDDPSWMRQYNLPINTYTNNGYANTIMNKCVSHEAVLPLSVIFISYPSGGINHYHDGLVVAVGGGLITIPPFPDVKECNSVAVAAIFMMSTRRIRVMLWMLRVSMLLLLPLLLVTLAQIVNHGRIHPLLLWVLEIAVGVGFLSIIVTGGRRNRRGCCG